MRWLVAQGIHELAINLHHAAKSVQDYFGTGERFGASITYSFEPVLLGTAGADTFDLSGLWKARDAGWVKPR